MNWKEHLAVGIITSLLTAYFLGLELLTYLLYLPIVIISSLLPDIDLENTKARKLANYAVLIGGGLIVFKRVEDLFSLSKYTLLLALFGAYSLFIFLFKPKHRGITHTLLANATYSLALYVVLGKTGAILGGTAYLSHLLADMGLRQRLL